MKLFTIGPVEMYPRTLEVRSKQIPYFRTDSFSKLNLETDEMLKNLMGTSQSSEVIYLTASGTGAMEATVINCLTEEDNVLVIEGGSFGKRFSQICEIHNIPYVPLKLEFGEELTSEQLVQYDNQKFTAMLVNLDETSTGQLYNIRLLSDFCKRHDMILIVDAISTFLCDEYKMDEYGVDVTIISSQKGLCIAPGMSMVVMNEKIVGSRIKEGKSKSLYFDFSDYIVNMKRGQTPFTPAVGIMYELNDMLKHICEIGIDVFLSHIDDMAKDFRHRIEDLPVSIPKYTLSNAITPVIFDKPIALEVFEKLRDNDKIFVNPSGGELGKKMFRVAHVGSNTIDDNRKLVELIEKYFR